MITGSEDSDGASVSNCVRSINLNNEALRDDLGCTVIKKHQISYLKNKKLRFQTNYTRALKYCKIQRQIFPRKNYRTGVPLSP